MKADVLEAYTDFAFVYDEFMDETPYDAWLHYLLSELKSADIHDGLLLDLGCGTGTMTRLLQEQGYDMIGVDASYDMLMVAMEQSDSSILYLCQDMRDFELYGTVRAIVSVCDCVNYILEPEELLKVFKLVNNYLDPGGLFIFDFNTAYKYKHLIGDTTIAENRDDCSFIWENAYDDEKQLNVYELTLFIKNDENEDYRKSVEEHYQRGYTFAEMKKIIEESGLIFVKAFDTDSLSDVTNTSGRITIVARENGK